MDSKHHRTFPRHGAFALTSLTSLAACAALLATAVLPAAFPQPSAAAQGRTGSLRIEKSVKASEYDPDVAFPMTVRFVPMASQSVDGTLAYVRETVETLTGRVSVTVTDGGAPALGSTLVAEVDETVGNLAGIDGTDIAYEWHRVVNGTDSIVGDGKPTYAVTDSDAGSDVYVSVSDASGRHVGAVKSDGVTVERPATVRYAVRIIGIGTDTGRDGKPLGLTFGPALGASYATSHVEHSPTGTDATGNAHRCVHADNWETIAKWSHRDPLVYEQCLSEGCTKSVPLSMGSKLGADGYRDGTGTAGDGASVLFDSVSADYRSWNGRSGDYDAAGGWRASYVRRTLNGKGRTDEADGADTLSSRQQRGTVLGDADSMYSALPSAIRDAIVPRATRSDVDYDKADGSSTVTTYDALWLPSMAEVGLGTREHEGSKYDALAKPGLAGYKEGGASGSWWLRSVSTLWDTSVYYILRGGSWSLYQSYGAGEAGLAFCFSLAGPPTTTKTAGDDGATPETGQGTTASGASEGRATSQGTVEVRDASFIIYVKGNESVTMAGIPEGTGYVVTEDTPVGWVGSGSTGTTGTIEDGGVSVTKLSNMRKVGVGQVTLSATKTLDGNPADGGLFEFSLYDDDGTPIQTARNADGGGIEFRPIEYSHGGTYHYVMSEKTSPDGSIEYDTRPVTITVTVSDAGNVSVAYDRVPRFENRSKDATGDSTRDADGTHRFTSAVTKALDGGRLSAGQFEFELSDSDGRTIATARNDVDGQVRFAPIEVTGDDTDARHYAIREVDDGQDGIEYDKTIVTLTVSRDGDGKLKGTYGTGDDGARRVAGSGESGWKFTNRIRGTIVQTGDGMRIVAVGIVIAGGIGYLAFAWRIGHRNR